MDSTTIRQVRLLIADVDPDREILTDDDIVDFLKIENESVKLAAASALDAIASSEAMVSKVIKTQDLSTDGARTSDALRKHAAALREQVNKSENDSESSFSVVPFSRCSPELTEEWWR